MSLDDGTAGVHGECHWMMVQQGVHGEGCYVKWMTTKLVNKTS